MPLRQVLSGLAQRAPVTRDWDNRLGAKARRIVSRPRGLWSRRSRATPIWCHCTPTRGSITQNCAKTPLPRPGRSMFIATVGGDEMRCVYSHIALRWRCRVNVSRHPSVRVNSVQTLECGQVAGVCGVGTSVYRCPINGHVYRGSDAMK